jgi:hypothetical protein
MFIWLSRSGFAAGCEAGLSPAVGFEKLSLGYTPRSGSAQNVWAKGRTRGPSPVLEGP